MENPTDMNRVATTAAAIGVSLDVWAVLLALGFAFLIRAGLIKNIPW
jgi:hypothetical protein